MAGTIVTDRIESDASYASSITVASPMVVSNTLTMGSAAVISGNVNIDNGTLFVNQNNNRVGVGGITNPANFLDVNTAITITENGVASSNTSLELYSRFSDNQRGYVILKAESNSSGSSDLVVRSRNNFSEAEKFRIDSVGRITKPNQPAFKAYHSGTQSVTGSNAANKMSFNTSQFNVGSSYNTSTSRFTAPVAGYYLFYAQIYFGSGSDGYYGVNIFKNGGQDNTYIYQRGGFGDVSALTTNIFFMNSGDYAEVYTYPVSSLTVPSASANFFTGYLLG
jgi:hypothetical protein